ncbi:transcriptional regulator, AraC family [Geotalea uraniireducens Rf4]|uniref:Transcriptional regulator, AraC family n=2 Tax=Geotalea uraniireducens TaxID=351604 RepID=A5GD53_GEOUR|nr:transcriptional regulator, AraC family [Geotalea uraniireducens Rf4]
MTREELALISRLVGDVSEDQLRYVDCFIGNEIGVFIPAVGPCFYAITPDHSHPAYSFVLTFDSYTRLAIGGKTVLSQPGQIMAIDPDAVHHEMTADETPRYIAIFIDRDLFEKELGRYPSIRPRPFRFRTFTPGREMMGLLKEFMNEAEARLPAREPLLAAIGTRIVHALIRAAHGIITPDASIGNRVEIHRVIEYIQTHAGKKLSIGQLAAVAAMSTSHFSRIFKRETGHPPLAYLNRVRLEQARKLLRTGECSVTSVALSCGFASPSHFTDSFRRFYGQSPTDFLKSYK